MTPLVRTAIAGMTLSAAGVAGLATHEGWSGTAIRPIPSDPWTICFGNTRWPDGTPVKQGDKATPVQCVQMLVAHASFDEEKLKKCVKATVNQTEYDLLVGHAYQFGVGKTCTSTMVKKINAGDYVGSCNGYPLWKNAGNKDCSVRDSGCYGVYTRALERRDQCLAAQTVEQTVAPTPEPETAPETTPSPQVTPPKPASKWPWMLGLLGAALGVVAGFIFWKRNWHKS